MGDHPSVMQDELVEARDLVVLADPEQLELIRDGSVDRDAGAAVRELERRGRGRPLGSRNRRNAKFRDQILALGPHPAIALQRAYSTPIEVLAAQLGCSRLDAAKLAMQAAAELLPYVEGKQPVTVDLRQQHDVVLIMGGAPGVGAGELEAIATEVNAEGFGGFELLDGVDMDDDIDDVATG